MIKKLLFISFLLISRFVVLGQENNDSIHAKSFNVSQITGTFGENRIFYKFRKNKKCKLILVAPRSLIHKGIWEIQNDTLICIFNKVNTIGKGDNKELRKNPMTYRFIVYKEKLFILRGENGHSTPILLTTEE